MKCPKCNGDKIIITNDTYIQGGIYDCDMCHGTGEIKMTNDEWRKTCSTEEFAKWLHSVRGYCSYINNCKRCTTKCKNGGWEGWLKEKC